jgi:hypothetical protein
VLTNLRSFADRAEWRGLYRCAAFHASSDKEQRAKTYEHPNRSSLCVHLILHFAGSERSSTEVEPYRYEHGFHAPASVGGLVIEVFGRLWGFDADLMGAVPFSHRIDPQAVS